MFEYDSTAPLNDTITSRRKEQEVTIEELTYDSPSGGPVTASLIRADESPGPGIIFYTGALVTERAFALKQWLMVVLARLPY